MSKEIELVGIFQTGLDNAVKISTQTDEESLSIHELLWEVRNIMRAHGKGAKVHISCDKEYGMVLTILSKTDEKFHSYALNRNKVEEISSSTTSE